MSIVIIDYGMGNLGSIQNMLKRIGHPAIISDDRAAIEQSEKLILPGVGSFDRAIHNIRKKNLWGVLDDFAQSGKPVLGICLGMQLLTSKSEEGEEEGFNWIPGSVYKFDPSLGIKVPHMGWNSVEVKNPSTLTKDLPVASKFYFVHSYYVKVDNPDHSILETEYSLTFDSAIQRGNIYGAQFHPEKSHKFGMQILKNFAGL